MDRNENDEGQWLFEPLAYVLRELSDCAAGLVLIGVILWAFWP